MKEIETAKKLLKSMPWKRILVVSIPLSVLVFNLFYFVLPNILHPLRVDPIPADAYVVPWMRPNPRIETIRQSAPPWGDMPPWDIENVMFGALKLNITFNMHTPNGTRTIPSTVYLGHDLEYLYIGAKFREIFANITPVSIGLGSHFSLYLDVDNDGMLVFPESGSAFITSIWPSSDWSPSGGWGYEDVLWDYGEWISAENYYSPNSPPLSSVKDMVLEYENSTGTLTILSSRHLRKPENAEINTLQMRQGERWVMGFNIELRILLEYFGDGLFVDGWPMNTFPYSSHDSFWWPKLVIDLTNPPPNF